MLDTILLMFAVIALGVTVRVMGVGRHGPDALRQGIADIVFYVLLPALVLKSLWHAELGWISLGIAAMAALGVISCLVVASSLCRFCQVSRPASGALVLAAAFPNATYLGLPVLEGLFGEPARSIAIQFDLFACTPLLLTLGIWTAQRYGSGGTGGGYLKLLNVPPLWAAALAVVLNLGGVAPGAWLDNLLGLLGGAVVPLMLLALGISLQWPEGGARRLGIVTAPVVLQLVFMPLLVTIGSGALPFEGWVRQAVVLEAAMPSMVIGIMLCDKYGLDSRLYALTVTVSTLLSLVTLPLWFRLLA